MKNKTSKTKKTNKHKAADRLNLIRQAKGAVKIIGEIEDSWTEITDCYMSDIQKLFQRRSDLRWAVTRFKEEYVSDKYISGATHSGVYEREQEEEA